MNDTKTLLAALVVAFLVFSASAMAAIPVEVSVGKGTVVTLKERSLRVALSEPSLADLLMISPTEMLINGKKAGTTSLIVWDRAGRRTFFDIFVTGDIGGLAEKIDALVGPEDDVEISVAKDTVILKGMLKNEETIKRVVATSQAYASKVVNLLKVAEPQQVILEVKVAQVDKTRLKELGVSALGKGSDAEGAFGLFSFPEGSLGGASAGRDLSPGITGFDLATVIPEIGVAHFPSGVAAVLRAMKENGLAKILAEPNLVVKSGEKGSFLAGSRVPVQQVTGTAESRTVSIVYEEVGVKINFAPEVLEDGRIRLKIDPAEVSNIKSFINFQGVIAPEIETREVRTSVELNKGESLVMAGLLSEETKKNVRKIPLLGDIPVLGAIFRTTREELEQTELVFFITPKLVKPLPPGSERPGLPGEELTPEEEKEFRWAPPIPEKKKKEG